VNVGGSAFGVGGFIESRSSDSEIGVKSFSVFQYTSPVQSDCFFEHFEVLTFSLSPTHCRSERFSPEFGRIFL
jgi:hypothetical protein